MLNAEGEAKTPSPVYFGKDEMPHRQAGRYRVDVMLRLEIGMSHTLKATFDGNVFRPDEPVGLRPNTRVRLIVEPAEDPERRPQSFLRVARSLKLEGPPDWSSRLDEYLYGAKGDS